MKTTIRIIDLITLIAVLGFMLASVSCSTRPDGSKTFAGLDAVQWGGVAVKTGTAYLDTKRQPVTNAKGVVEVQPEPEMSWISAVMNLLGF